MLFYYHINIIHNRLPNCSGIWESFSITIPGISSNLLYNSEYYLALISILVFSPLIGYHSANQEQVNMSIALIVENEIETNKTLVFYSYKLLSNSKILFRIL